MWGKIDPQIGLLTRGLDVSHFRQGLISDNIANADTPNYKRKDIDFSQAMGAAVARQKEAGLVKTDPRHLGSTTETGSELKAVEEGGTRTRLDGNNVDIEVEMAKLAGNGLYYQTAGRLLSGRYGILEKIINTGRP